MTEDQADSEISVFISASYWASSIGLAISSFFLVLPLYTSCFILKSRRPKDYFIIFPGLLTTIPQWSILLSIDPGPETKLIFVASLLFILGIALAKVKVCIHYCEIFPHEPLPIIFKCNIAFIIVCSFGIVLSHACITIEASHGSLIPIVQAVTSMTADLILMTTASQAIIGLQMPCKKKLIIIIKLAIFQSTMVTATIRLGILIRGGQQPNATFVTTPQIVSLIADADLAIVCGSLDMLALLVKHFERRFIHKQPALTNGKTDVARDMGHRQNEIEMGAVGSGSRTLGHHPSDEALVKQ